MGKQAARNDLTAWYRSLMAAYGPQHWWPARSRLEVVVGAILTQNTNWRNVERAITRLRRARALSWRRLRDLPVAQLQALVRPAGTYRVKARRLKCFVGFLFERYGGQLRRMARTPLQRLRAELLTVSGIGPETADAILLYALDRPTFVVDAYTRRVAARHGLVPLTAGYEEVQQAFEGAVPRDLTVYNEFHALLVEVGKRHCRTAARCEGCPLERFEHQAGALNGGTAAGRAAPGAARPARRRAAAPAG